MYKGEMVKGLKIVLEAAAGGVQGLTEIRIPLHILHCVSCPCQHPQPTSLIICIYSTLHAMVQVVG